MDLIILAFLFLKVVTQTQKLGQFGSRDTGGKDHASSRYVHTYLSKLTRLIYPEPDDHLLKYLDDDGKIVEP